MAAFVSVSSNFYLLQGNVLFSNAYFNRALFETLLSRVSNRNPVPNKFIRHDAKTVIFPFQNGDGFISFPEYIFFVTLLSIPPWEVEQAFHTFDLDNSGMVDKDEFKSVRARTSITHMPFITLLVMLIQVWRPKHLCKSTCGLGNSSIGTRSSKRCFITTRFLLCTCGSPMIAQHSSSLSPFESHLRRNKHCHVLLGLCTLRLHFQSRSFSPTTF